MVPFGNRLLFAKEGGNEVQSFDLYSKCFKCVFHLANLQIAAMCANSTQVFILDQKNAAEITVLDSNFKQKEKITTHLEEVENCKMDMCAVGRLRYSLQTSSYSEFRFQEKDVVTDNIIISTSSPNGSITALSQNLGVLWKIDRTHTEIGEQFNPCSVTASVHGDIYFADRDSDKVVLYCGVHSHTIINFFLTRSFSSIGS